MSENRGITVVGLERLLGALDGLASDASNTVPALEEVAERAFRPVMAAKFESEGHGRWRPRSEAYRRRLERRFGRFNDLPIGQVTGALKRSLSQKGVPSNVQLAVGDAAVLVGTRRPYAAAFASQRSLELEPEEVERLEEVLADEFKQGAQRRGFRAL